MPVENASVSGVRQALIRGVCARKHVIRPPKFTEHFDYMCIHSFIHSTNIDQVPTMLWIHTHVNVYIHICAHVHSIHMCVHARVCIYAHRETRQETHFNLDGMHTINRDSLLHLVTRVHSWDFRFYNFPITSTPSAPNILIKGPY